MSGPEQQQEQEQEPVVVTVHVKGDERYVWLYHDGEERDVIQSIGRFAANPELSLTWRDAAGIVQSLKRECAR